MGDKPHGCLFQYGSIVGTGEKISEGLHPQGGLDHFVAKWFIKKSVKAFSSSSWET